MADWVDPNRTTNPITGATEYYDPERGLISEGGSPATADKYASLPGYKPFDFGTALGHYRQPGNASLQSADNPELSGYFQSKYGAAMDQAYRNQLAQIQNSGGMQLWNAQNPTDFATQDTRTWDTLLMPAFQASGAAADPRFQEYANILQNVSKSGREVDAANEAALDKKFMKQVMTGLALTGGVMGAGALGLFGGGGVGAGGALAGAPVEGAWGVVNGLSPEVLQAIGTGSAIDMGGTGLTAAQWAASQAAPFAGMGGVGAGQLGAGGLGLGSFTGVGGGGFGVGGANTAIEGGFNAGGAINPTGSFGGGAQTPAVPQQGGFSGTPGGGGGQWPGAQPSAGPGATSAINAPPGSVAKAATGSAVAGAGGGGQGGGDFVSGILEQFKKNALSLGMMGLSLLGAGSAAGKEPESIKQLGQNANTASQAANEYLAAARAGQLTGPQQASLDQYKQNAKNQVRQYFASIGQFDSTSRIQAEAQIDQTAVAMQQQLIQQTLENGLNLMGASNTPLAQVAQYQAGQDQALVNAMGSFAQGIGSLFGQQAGKGQISQPGQQQPRPPAQQSPAIAQPQSNVAPQIQQEPYYEPLAP